MRAEKIFSPTRLIAAQSLLASHRSRSAHEVLGASMSMVMDRRKKPLRHSHILNRDAREMKNRRTSIATVCVRAGDAPPTRRLFDNRRMMKMQHVYNDGGRAASGFTGSASDCVCRSIAIVTGLPYLQLYERLAKGNASQRATKRSGKRARSASQGIYTKRKWFRDYMESLGFRWVPTMHVGQGCKVHLADGELPMGRIVVSLSRHYTAVIDGVIHDTHDPQRDKSYMFEPDRGQSLKANQGRNENGVWTEIGGRCVYGYWVRD